MGWIQRSSCSGTVEQHFTLLKRRRIGSDVGNGYLYKPPLVDKERTLFNKRVFGRREMSCPFETDISHSFNVKTVRLWGSLYVDNITYHRYLQSTEMYVDIYLKKRKIEEHGRNYGQQKFSCRGSSMFEGHTHPTQRKTLTPSGGSFFCDLRGLRFWAKISITLWITRRHFFMLSQLQINGLRMTLRYLIWLQSVKAFFT